MPNYNDAYEYFRLALATGLLDIPSVIAWADEELMRCDAPPAELIELSLSGRMPYSQIIRQLNVFKDGWEGELPVYLLLARAGRLLADAPASAPCVLTGLWLLNAEARLPRAVHAALPALNGAYEQHRRSHLGIEAVRAFLEDFLAPYHAYRAALDDMRLP